MKNSLKVIVNNKWLLVYSVLFSIMWLLSSKIKIGNDIFIPVNDCQIQNIRYIDLLWVFLLTCVVFVGLVFVGKLLNKFKLKAEKKRKKTIIITMMSVIGMLLAWTPYILSYFPGGLYSDTITSIKMACWEIPLNNHHPILYTIFWRLIYRIGTLFCWSDTTFIFAFTLIQCFLLAISCSFFVGWSYKKGFNKYWVILNFCFFAFFPLVPFYGISLWKDTPFSVAFFLYSLFFLDQVWEKYKEVRIRDMILYSLLTFFVAFLRNNGLYVVIISSFLYVFYVCNKKRKNAKLLVLLTILLLGVFVILQGPVYKAKGYSASQKIESFGIPLQQISYMISVDAYFAEEDMIFLNNIMPIETIKEEYRPLVVDTLKWNHQFDTQYFNDNWFRFLKVYVRAVVHNPIDAIKGYALATLGFWDINKQMDVAYINNFMWSSSQIEMQDLFKKYLGGDFAGLVQPKRLYSTALFGWIIFAAVIFCLERKEYNGVIPLAPIIILWLSLMIATPIAFSLRYLFPAVLLMPMSVVMLVGVEKTA